MARKLEEFKLQFEGQCDSLVLQNCLSLVRNAVAKMLL